jgi:hypothetical protein
LTACASAGAGAKKPEAAASPSKPSPISTAVEQPFKDLNVVRDEGPNVVRQAALDPYAAPKSSECADLAREISELSAALGPDVDTPAATGHVDVEKFVGEAVEGVAHLPFRGVVRWISGAAERDRRLALAITAAIARRGFLRGFAQAKGCS